MPESIFSRYSAGENRVTATLLAVLHQLALPRIEQVLGALIEDSDFRLVSFLNQVSAGSGSVPDGLIASSCRLYLETKVVRYSLTRNQLEQHLKHLDTSSEKNRLLLVLTPDTDQPGVIDEIGDERLVWSSFAALNQVIDDLLAGEQNEREVVSEREEFLLRELQKMLLAEGLLNSSKEVLVIPARHAWPLYQHVHAYICQAGRAFQPAKHIAFYANNQIYPVVPSIIECHDQVVFEPGRNPGRLGELVDHALRQGEIEGWPYRWSVHKVFLLTAPDSPETLRLEKPVVNDLASEKGQRIAFTQNQRYISLAALRNAKKTSELRAG